MLVVVASSACNRPDGAAADRAGSGWGDGLRQWDELLTVVDVGRRGRYQQWQTGGVAEHMRTRVGLASVDRAQAGRRTPFFARTLTASTTTRDVDRRLPARAVEHRSGARAASKSEMSGLT
jgi:hypothetical protein